MAVGATFDAHGGFERSLNNLAGGYVVERIVYAATSLTISSALDSVHIAALMAVYQTVLCSPPHVSSPFLDVRGLFKMGLFSGSSLLACLIDSTASRCSSILCFVASSSFVGLVVWG